MYTSIYNEEAEYRARCGRENIRVLHHIHGMAFYTTRSDDGQSSVYLPVPELHWDDSQIAIYNYGKRHEYGHNSKQCEDIFSFKPVTNFEAHAVNIIDDYRNDHQQIPYKGDLFIKQVGRFEWNARNNVPMAGKDKYTIFMSALYGYDHEYRKNSNVLLKTQMLRSSDDTAVQCLIQEFVKKVPFEAYDAMRTVEDVLKVYHKLVDGHELPPAMETPIPMFAIDALHGSDPANERLKDSTITWGDEEYTADDSGMNVVTKVNGSARKIITFASGVAKKCRKYDQETGKIHTTMLPRYKSSDGKIFKDVKITKAKKLAIAVVMDGSGSMRTRMDAQMSAVYSLFFELRKMKGFECMATIFSGSKFRFVKKFKEPLQHKMFSNAMAGGGTLPELPALNALSHLDAFDNTYKKLFIMTTDGKFDAEKTKKSLAAFRHIPTLGIAIKINSFTLENAGFEKHAEIEDPAEIFDVVYKAIKEMYK